MSHYGNRTTTRTDRINRLIETDIHCCQSAMVDMLLKSGELDGWTCDDIEGIYIDPSNWTAQQCYEHADDIGIKLDNDPRKMDREDLEDEVFTAEGKTDDELRQEIAEANLDSWREDIRDNTDPREPLEWWLVSRDLCNELRDLGEIVIDNDYGYWWGRTCSGQSIELDGVWDDWCDMRGVE